MGRTVTKDTRAFKRAYLETGSVRKSMLAAGYTPASAAHSTRALPIKLRQYVDRQRQKANKYTALGSSLSAEEQENLTRGRLIANAIEGKDQAVNSLKLLGQDRRVGMWQPENSGAVIFIQPPAQVLEKVTQVIEATEIKQLPGQE